MKSLALLLGLLVAVQALPAKGPTPLPVIEGAPVPIEPNIIGGDTAKPGQFPYQAAIVIDGGSTVACGGSLIARDWILTAAYCAQGTTFRVILGRTQWQGSGGADIMTTEKIVHINYNPDTRANDIALLRLPTLAPLSNYIQLVDLTTKADALNDFDNNDTQISGWGWTTVGGGISPDLMFVNMTIITNSECFSHFGTNIIVSSTICATAITDGKIPCTGDTGGPLVIYEGGVGYKQIGIASFWSPNGCVPNQPSAFTRVTSFRDWIKQNTGV